MATAESADSSSGRRVWGVATVTVEFDVSGPDQSARVAEQLFEDPGVLTVRVGGVGERSVYRVDVVQGRAAAEAEAVGVAARVAVDLGMSVQPIRVTVTRDGLGDPERGARPDERELPWRRAQRAR